jgi:predicted house-cleaning noncanonical NTP pyrophosphatase (MazG superfamily)/ADP-ribose pyrophosphatase YjhB (NUDIX family)
MDRMVRGALARVLADVGAERVAQDARWGVQEFPDGTGGGFAGRAEEAQRETVEAARRGEVTWRHVLLEEVFEALAESEPVGLRTELIQTAAVAVQWVQALDRRYGAMQHEVRPGGREKLIRDLIPAADTRTAGADEYLSFLKAKLYEEAGEYVASGDPAELVDVLEVVRALGHAHGLSPEELEEKRAGKYRERGGFTQRKVLRLPMSPVPKPQVRHAVRALLLDEDDNLILFRRTKPGHELYWSTPGGQVEEGDADGDAALRRELDEELGATVGPLRQVFVYAEQTPGLHYLSTFYVCRLVEMNLARRHGPEFDEPANGVYDVARIPCDPAAIEDIDLFPEPLSAYLLSHVSELPRVADLPY